MRPLAGVRVLDLGQVVAGPLCAHHLAALGAEVIRVERPGGDLSARVGPFVGPDGTVSDHREPDTVSLSHLRRGRGKRNVVVDLEQPAGQQVVRDLVAVSDVLVENFRPTLLASWGLAHDRLVAVNPTLVHVSITGFGHGTARGGMPALDPVVQAMSGLMAKTGFPDGDPVRAGVTLADQLPAVFGALAAVAALHERPRRSRFLDVAMMDTMTSLLWDEPLDLYQDLGVAPRQGNADWRGAPMDSFPTRDGHVVVVVANDAQWHRLVDAIGQPELARRWPTLADRRDHVTEVNGALAGWTAQRRTDEVLSMLADARIPGGPVQAPWAARHDPDTRLRGVLQPLTAPGGDRPPFLGPALPVVVDGHAPVTAPTEPLGASTDEVLTGLLGRSEDQVQALRHDGVVA